MSDLDLLSAVQSDKGWFCVVGIKDKSVKQKFYATREEVDQAAGQLVSNNINVFFGVAKYKEPTNRTKDNVLNLKAFWLDIDCGEEKAKVNEKTGKPAGYADQAAGLTALMAFCKGTGLPRPIVVNSGRGLHIYWPLKKAVTREEWEPVADRLRQTCLNNNLYVDPAVFEAARVLRVPGTLNFKDDPPEEVKIVNYGNPVSLEDFSGKLDGTTASVVAKKPNNRPLSALTLALRGNETTLFDKIMRAKPGCAQLRSCYQDRATLSEPRWFNALSVAKFCEDKDVAIHALSSDHPDYDPAVVEAKITHILGPATCETFARNNPGGCDKCPYAGKFRSPIALGRDVNTRQEEVEVTATDKEGKEEVHIIPAFPPPYFRGDTGGVLKKTAAKEDQNGEKTQDEVIDLIYPRDIYPTKRMNDPRMGDVVVIKYHSPTDGVKTFPILNSCVADMISMRVELAKHGVLCAGRKFDELAFYLIHAINHLQEDKKAESMRLQMGWADKHSRFIIGDREITKDGIYHSPPSGATRETADKMTPTGTLEKWKEVFKLYGTPGLEPHAFGALTAFGSPLFGFLGHNGATISIVNPGSGQGKSTILHMCNSVYGDPKNLCFQSSDTKNGGTHKLGIFNNIPVTLDEKTNIEPKDLSDFLYGITSGSGKDRMKRNGIELQQNHTRWSLLALCTSNAPFADKLMGIKDNPDGELMRVMEYQLNLSTALDMSFAKDMFDRQLLENYGHAGDIYCQWLVNNLERALELLRTVQAKLDKELRLTQRERYWSAIVASNITGGIIAKKYCRLIDWDMEEIYAFACRLIETMRREVAPPLLNHSYVIGDFMNRHIQNTLVADDAVDSRTKLAKLPKMEPKGELVIRVEPDTNLIFISAKHFQNDCSKRQISYKDTITRLKEVGALVKVDTKRMAKGMKVTTPGVHALYMDASHDMFAGMLTNLIPAVVDEKPSEDSGS